MLLYLKRFASRGIMPSWNFLSNHGAILVLVATEPSISANEISSRLGITERPVRRIISELVDEGYLYRAREGRRNRYTVNENLPIPGPVTRDIAVGNLLRILRLVEPTLRR